MIIIGAEVAKTMKTVYKSNYVHKKKSSFARRQNRLLEHFVVGTTERAAAAIIGVQPNTAIRFYMRLRFLIASQLPCYELNGEVEADETTKAHEKTGCGVAMDAHGFGGRPGSRSGNKHPQQIHLFAEAKSTSSCIYFIILSLLLS
jgi:hypothetical protein